jgi:rod shape-determining protein MreC
MLSPGSSGSYKYRIQREDRDYDGVLFRFLLLLTLALVNISINIRHQFGNEVTQYIVYPLVLGHEYVRQTTISIADSCFRHIDTRDKLETMERDNRNLRQNLTKARLNLTELRSMAATWDLHLAMPDIHTKPARVIHRVPDTWQRTLVLDRGSAHGIERMMPAVVPGASGNAVLIGHIIAVRPFTSKLLLIDDRQSAASVRVAEYETMVKGDGDGCYLELQRNISVETGQLIFTSGQGLLYPPDLLLGSIRSSRPDEEALLFKYQLDLPFRTEKLTEVLILTYWNGREALLMEHTR